MTVFIPQADDLEVLPGQTDLHSDRGSRYGELILGSLRTFLSDARQPEVRPSPFLYALTLTNLYC